MERDGSTMVFYASRTKRQIDVLLRTENPTFLDEFGHPIFPVSYFLDNHFRHPGISLFHWEHYKEFLAARIVLASHSFIHLESRKSPAS